MPYEKSKKFLVFIPAVLIISIVLCCFIGYPKLQEYSYSLGSIDFGVPSESRDFSYIDITVGLRPYSDKPTLKKMAAENAEKFDRIFSEKGNFTLKEFPQNYKEPYAV